jgi:hypothetical protein
MRLRVRIVLAVALAVTACKKTDNKPPAAVTAGSTSKGDARLVQIRTLEVEAAVAARTSAAFDRPAVAQAFDAALGALANDPKVSPRLAAFLAKLQADPRIAGVVNDLMDHLMDDPRVAANVQQIMADNPGATPDQVGDLFGNQLAQRWASPEVSKAWLAGWDEVTKKVGARPGVAAMFSSLVNKATSGLSTPASELELSRTLIEKNGGQFPDLNKATQLVLDQMWTNDRIDKLLIMLLTNPTVRSATAQFLSDVLADEEITKAVISQAGAIAANKVTYGKALRALQVLYAKDVAVADAASSLRALMTDDALTAGLGDLLSSLAKSPRLAALATKWYDTMAADPKLESDLTAFLDNW